MDELSTQAVVQAVLSELNVFFDAGGTERLLRFIGSINPNDINGSQNFVFVDDGLNGNIAITFEYHVSQDRMYRHIVFEDSSFSGHVLNQDTISYINYGYPHPGFGGDPHIGIARNNEAIHAKRVAEARENRDNHIRAIINTNPNWTQAQKDALVAAVLKLVKAADLIDGWIGTFPPGTLG
jgi:hypothetical protein